MGSTSSVTLSLERTTIVGRESETVSCLYIAVVVVVVVVVLVLILLTFYTVLHLDTSWGSFVAFSICWYAGVVMLYGGHLLVTLSQFNPNPPNRFQKQFFTKRLITNIN
jgi:hypothetical protein